MSKNTAPGSGISLEELLEGERTEDRRKDRPRTLALEDIHVADFVFQWRLENDNLLADQHHIRELARVLGDQEEPLDALLVTPVGTKFYLVDGHHRLAAYRERGWSKAVPVEVFEGTLLEAWTEALKRNVRDKLPMTRQSKYEAAWTLNKMKNAQGGYLYSKAQIHKMTSASDGLIANMRRVLEQHGQKAAEATWRKAKALQWEQDNKDFDVDDWKETAARTIAEKLMSSVGINLTANADIFAAPFPL